MERDFKGVWIPREVWLDENLSALEKVILIEIDSLDTEDGHCFASNRYLAEFCQCSEIKISQAIRKFIELGYIEQVSFDGRTRILRSRLKDNLRQTYKKYKADLKKIGHNNIEINIENNIDNIKEKNIKKEILEESTLPVKETTKPSEKMLKEEFEEVWKQYPKREGKANALKSYVKARKEGVPREEIEAGIERYIDMLKSRGTEVQYIKMGSTWFNQRGWEDEYSKPARKVMGTGTTNENDEITDTEPLF